MTIDLNADVGEGCDDGPLYATVTSVSVACGGHAGDEASMRLAVRAALARGLAVGAHPSDPDREGFGRREVATEPAALERSLVEQIAALEAVARAEGARLEHVKPHGALYNRAARDPQTARLVVRAVRAVSPALVVVGLAGSRLVEAARAAGLEALGEAFADRRDASDGSLAPRGVAGAVVAEPGAAAAQALDVVRRGRVRALDGAEVAVAAETICVHGDTPGAAAIGAAVRRALEAAGITVRRYRGST